MIISFTQLDYPNLARYFVLGFSTIWITIISRNIHTCTHKMYTLVYTQQRVHQTNLSFACVIVFVSEA